MASQESTQRTALNLALGGEFAFVISSVTLKTSLLTHEQANFLNPIVTFSMVVTPVLLFLQERVGRKKLQAPSQSDKFDHFGNYESQVVIAGFGRFGQIFGRILRAQILFKT